MTNEKKMKDLMAGMVSMSPQPPDFPEEMEMAKPSVQRRRSPALIFAVAAAAVLVLAVPLFLWDGGDGEPVGGDTTTTSAPATETTVPTTTTTVPLPVEVSGVVYLYQEPGNSFTGNPALVPFELRLPSEDEWDQGAGVQLLVRLARLGIGIPQGFFTTLPEGLEVTVGSAGAQLITVDMNQRFLEGAGGLLADITMLNQLVYTATQENPGAKVLFTVEGQPIEAYGTEGISLLDPVGREDGVLLDGLNPIILTEPVVVSDGVVEVVGRANVFEAALSYRVTGTGIEGFTTATCGTGCWGDFEFTLDAAVLPEGSFIEVFSASAEDGSPMFVVRVPVPTDS